MMNRFRIIITNSVWVPVLLTAVLYGAFILLRLGFHAFNPTFFITAGDIFCDPGRLPANFLVLKNCAGYDGQGYYCLALDPFTAEPSAGGVKMDSPSYRQQRIVYPLLVWLFSAAQPEYVPAVMILVNYVFLCGMAWLGGWYAKSFNVSALWGIIFPLYPGFLLTLARDLTEIVAAFFILASLVLLRKNKPVAAAALLSLGVLARETTLLVALGSALAYCWNLFKRGTGNPVPWYFFSLPAFCYCAWQILLFFQWGVFPFASGVQNFGLPFAGVSRFIASLLPPASAAAGIYFLELLFIICCLFVAACTARSSAAEAHVKITWVLYGLLMVLLTELIWCDDWAFLRAFTECGVLISILVLGAKSRLLLPLFLYEAVIWLGLFYLRVLYV
jgi:hypothetical protein